MSQPTQQLPPWLQPSVVVVTDAAGVPIATNTEIIPLGSLYIFGGSTEPPTIVFTPTTTVANSATPTATPPITTSPTTTPLTTSAIPTTTVLTTSTAITSSPTSATPSTTAITSNSASNSASSSSLSVSAASSASSISSILSSTIASSTATSATSGSSSLTASPTIPSTSVSVVQPPTQTFSASPTVSGNPARFGGLTKGQLVGVIVASILGLIFLFVLALFLCLWCKGRRNRRHRFESLSPNAEDSYVFVPAGSTRVPGEGSPRHSGEEADPFLQESSHQSNWLSEVGPGVAGTSTSRGSYRNSPLANVAAVAESSNGHGQDRNMTQVTGAPVTRTPVTRVPPPTMGSNSSGSASTVSHASGFGVLLDRPSLSGVAYLPITHEHETEGGRPLSHADMARIDNEEVLPHEDTDVDDPNYTGAYAYSRYSEPPTAPPRLVIPGASPSPENLPFTISNPSSLQDLQEASLQTATRVKAQDLAPRSTPVSPAGSSAHSSRPQSGRFLGALGLGGVGAWFNKNQSSPRHTAAHEHSSLLEKDLEQGALLAPNVGQVDSLGLRPAGTGLTSEGRRPVSNVSGRSGASGGTLFHDAHSSLPATPVTPFLAPLPRAVTPAEPNPSMPGDERAWLGSSHNLPVQRTPSPQEHSARTGYDMADADILDMPAPSALHHFSSGSGSSLKEMHTGSSAGGIKVAPFPPPGLSTIRPVGWSNAPPSAPEPQAQAEMTSYPSPPASLGSDNDFGGLHGLNLGRGVTIDLDADMDLDLEDDLGLGHGISIDVLEEAPPGAEQGWRSISSAGTGAAYMDNGRRGTFGMLVQGPGYASEQGSLHSMRSHVSPGSARSTGSAPTTYHDMSINSFSSGRNSATSHNLSRTGSLTSDNQRGRRTQPAGSLNTIIASPSKALTVRTMGSDTTAANSTMRPIRSLSPLGGPDFPLNAPWAAGLDNEWQASA
ncbi:hypothetical protein D9619_004292 [Psilocybe cf. subviscida]|uniref:Uncharacterized protein n=1 Tax=Psilocybe cf. subviscida TaxID=2480587 RepID=A0A8H5BP09_9AGAR|nr:hypothetical protein D9619_004292 [Psilocybe cf. subviscida]